MSNVNEKTEAARKVLPIIYVLDTSGSMCGNNIAAVNEAMREAIEDLTDISLKNRDADIKVGILKFSTGAEWVTDGLSDLNGLCLKEIDAGGITDLASALTELHDKLSGYDFLKDGAKSYAPVIIFMSDGTPTDDWEEKLELIKSRDKWFANAIKIAVAAGYDADTDCLAALTGNPEAVITAADHNTLKTAIMYISSIAASAVITEAEGGNAVDIIDQAKKMIGKSGVVSVEATGSGSPDDWT